MDQALIKTVTMQTLKGHVQATVVPVKCAKCNNIVGKDPSEYNCLDGAESIWFHKDLLDLDLKYFIESQLSVTRLTAAKVLSAINDERGCDDKNRVIYDAYSKAHRLHMFIL